MRTAAKKGTAERGAKKSAGKKSAAGKSAVKKTVAKKTAAHKTAAKRSAGKKSTAKKTAAKKTGAKKTGAKSKHSAKRGMTARRRRVLVLTALKKFGEMGLAADFAFDFQKSKLLSLTTPRLTPRPQFLAATTGRVVKSSPVESRLGEKRIEAAVKAVVGTRYGRG